CIGRRHCPRGHHNGDRQRERKETTTPHDTPPTIRPKPRGGPSPPRNRALETPRRPDRCRGECSCRSSSSWGQPPGSELSSGLVASAASAVAASHLSADPAPSRSSGTAPHTG